MSKSVAITGINGQIAAFLARKFLKENYKVYGLIRRSSTLSTYRINDIMQQLDIQYGDLSDGLSIVDFVQNSKPDIFINTAAMSHVKVSFDNPVYCADSTGTGVIRCLETIRKLSPHTHFITMSSSEMFGSSPPIQNEKTPFKPQSIYAASKVMGYHSVINYRNAHKIKASNAIAFNSESEYRGEHFFTMKSIIGAINIKLGKQEKLYLGTIKNIYRDWTYAGDTAEAIYRMAIASEPDDYCICSGNSHSLEEFLDYTFSKLDLDYKDFVEYSDKYYRPTEVEHLCGSYDKIKNNLGWEPKVKFHELIDKMLNYRMSLVK